MATGRTGIHGAVHVHAAPRLPGPGKEPGTHLGNDGGGERARSSLRLFEYAPTKGPGFLSLSARAKHFGLGGARTSVRVYG